MTTQTLIRAALALAIATGCGGAAGDSGDSATSGENNVTNAPGGTPGTPATPAAPGTAPDDGAPSPLTNTADPGQPAKFDIGTADIKCTPIKEGASTVTVNGKSRSFFVQLPKDTARMALLFLWHGWNQEATTFRDTVVYDVPKAKWVPFDPNAFNMPLMVVTPVDTGMLPPSGLDWDIVSGAKDFPYFEGMLKCIGDQFNVDGNRLYSFGFSAGAVFTNLLSAKYPHLFAATMSESGAWFNDKPEQSDVLVPIMGWKWPAFVPADRGNVLLTHGGDHDFATVISLESANKKAIPFLRDNKRTVIECQHTFGHTLDPDLTQAMYYDYMWSHTLEGAPLTALPSSFPTKEKPVGATSCTFHPPAP